MVIYKQVIKNNKFRQLEMYRIRKVIMFFLVLFSPLGIIYSQQDPQYTQYMYNTMNVNLAYAGSKGHSVIVGLARVQWLGIKGAPNTQTLSYDTPFDFSRLGFGVNLNNDIIGPSNEIYLDINTSYSIDLFSSNSNSCCSFICKPLFMFFAFSNLLFRYGPKLSIKAFKSLFS